MLRHKAKTKSIYTSEYQTYISINKAHLIQGSYFKTVYELFPSDNHHKPWLYDGWLFSNHHHLYPQKQVNQ